MIDISQYRSRIGSFYLSGHSSNKKTLNVVRECRLEISKTVAHQALHEITLAIPKNVTGV